MLLKLNGIQLYQINNSEQRIKINIVNNFKHYKNVTRPFGNLMTINKSWLSEIFQIRDLAFEFALLTTQ